MKTTQQHKDNLKAIIIKAAQGIKVRHYKSQPLPLSYSQTYWTHKSEPQPSQMQEAFIKAVLH